MGRTLKKLGKRRTKVGGFVNPCEDPIMRFHLKADIIHDHGKIDIPSIQTLFAYDGDDPTSTAEDKVVEYFKKTYDGIDDKALRFQQIIHFTAKDRKSVV